MKVKLRLTFKINQNLPKFINDEHDVTDETIEKILPILEINEPDLDLNGNDSSYKLGIN